MLVGERKDSQTYVRMKTKACEEVGIKSQQVDLPETISQVFRCCGSALLASIPLIVPLDQADLLTVIHKLNDDAAVNGILVQVRNRTMPSTDPSPIIDPYFDVGFVCVSASAAEAHRF